MSDSAIADALRGVTTATLATSSWSSPISTRALKKARS